MIYLIVLRIMRSYPQYGRDRIVFQPDKFNPQPRLLRFVVQSDRL